MLLDEVGNSTIMRPEIEQLGEEGMVDEERWKEIRRLCWEERVSISEVARRFAVDRKTVRHCLRQETWRPYQRAPKAETLLSAHAEFLRERGPAGRLLGTDSVPGA